MPIGILGNKIGMTQIFDDDGKLVAVTVIKTDSCFITSLKSDEKDGYSAVQIGYGRTEKGLKKPQVGHLSKNKLPLLRFLREYKLKKEETNTFEIGNIIDLNNFKKGDFVTISGLTIGKGNIGNLKRHNFHRGPMTHGSKHHRLQGSLGAGTTPGRVFPGKRMPGKTGMEKRTIKNLKIMDINLENNLIVLKGSIPGKFGNLISIQKR